MQFPPENRVLVFVGCEEFVDPTRQVLLGVRINRSGAINPCGRSVNNSMIGAVDQVIDIQ